MRLHILSDLHIDNQSFTLPEVDADVIVIAGDVGAAPSVIQWLKNIKKPIIYVAGNHEYYFHEISEWLDLLRRSNIKHFLENDQIVLNGVRFLGCTLWTDFALMGDARKAREDSENRLSDYRRIFTKNGSLTGLDVLGMHTFSRRWLTGKLNEPFEGPTVVVTHFAPSINCCAPRPLNYLAPSFIVDMGEMFGKCKLWVHGHTHGKSDLTINGTRIISNQLGYAGESLMCRFNPKLVVEV